MRTLIFANGEFNLPPKQILENTGHDVVIAADGGLRNAQTVGIRPDVLIGDLDSLTEVEVQKMAEDGVNIIRHPARKDYTDLELALQYAIELGSDDILVLGALGKRWDQTMANLLVAAAEAFQQIKIRLVDGPQQIHLMRGGHSLELQGQPGDTVSLIPLCGDVTGISTSGLEYPLNNEALHFGGTRGVSNVLTGEKATISTQDGFLLVVQIQQGHH